MKGASGFVHLVTLLKEENKTLRKANEKETKQPKRQKMSERGEAIEAGPATQRCCSNCGKTGHNVRTCQEVEETSDEGSYVVSG